MSRSLPKIFFKLTALLTLSVFSATTIAWSAPSYSNKIPLSDNISSPFSQNRVVTELERAHSQSYPFREFIFEPSAAETRPAAESFSPPNAALKDHEVDSIYKFMAIHVLSVSGALDVLFHVIKYALAVYFGRDTFEPLALMLLIGVAIVAEISFTAGFPLTRRLGVGFHEFGHLVEAIERKAIKKELLPQAQEEWNEAKKNRLGKFKFMIKHVWAAYSGKSPYIERDDENERQFSVPLEGTERDHPLVVRAGALIDNKIWKFGITIGLFLYFAGWLAYIFTPTTFQHIEAVTTFSLLGIVLARFLAAQAIVGRFAYPKVDNRAYSRLRDSSVKLAKEVTSEERQQRKQRYADNRKTALNAYLNNPPTRAFGLVNGKPYIIDGVQRSRILLHGGAHAGKLGGNLSWQEFKILVNFNDPELEAVVSGEIQSQLLELINASTKAQFVAVGPEGGFVATFDDYERGALELVEEAIEKAGYESGGLKKTLPETLEELETHLKNFETNFESLKKADVADKGKRNSTLRLPTKEDREFFNKVVFPEGKISPTLDPQAKGKLFQLLKDNFGWKVGVWMAVDVAAATLREEYQKETGRTERVYRAFKRIKKRDWNSKELDDEISKLVDDFPILTIEDPKDDTVDSLEEWVSITKRLEGRALVIADDLAVTNPRRLRRLVEESLEKYGILPFHLVLMKANQIGTVGEMLLTFQVMQEYGLQGVVSHRSGSGDDPFEARVTAGVNMYMPGEEPERPLAVAGKWGGRRLTERERKFLEFALRSRLLEAGISYETQDGATIKFIEASAASTGDGRDTIQLHMILSTDKEITSVVPIGASVGRDEAIFLYDDRKAKKGVFYAIQQFNDYIKPRLKSDLALSEIKSQTDLSRFLLSLERDRALQELFKLAEPTHNRLYEGHTFTTNRAALEVLDDIISDRIKNGTLEWNFSNPWPHFEELLKKGEFEVQREQGNDITFIVNEAFDRYFTEVVSGARLLFKEHLPGKFNRGQSLSAGQLRHFSGGLTKDELMTVMERKAFLGMNTLLLADLVIGQAAASVQGMSYELFIHNSKRMHIDPEYLYGFRDKAETVLQREHLNELKTDVLYGEEIKRAREAQQAARDQDDYYIEPVSLSDEDVAIQPGDSVIMTNFRSDRAYPAFQLLTGNKKFGHFPIRRDLNLAVAPFAVYDDTYFNENGYEGIVSETSYDETLEEVIARSGKTQVRIAESDKFKHVNFFADGKRNLDDLRGTDRIEIPGNEIEGGAHYEKPEMKALEIAEETIKWILGTEGREAKDFGKINLANMDIIGHFDRFNAAVNAAEAVDMAIGIIREAVRKANENGANIALVITADHGSGEDMAKLDVNGNPLKFDNGRVRMNKAHAFDNKVPFIIEGLEEGVTLKQGSNLSLLNIAPTIAELMGVQPSSKWNEESLLENYQGKPKRVFQIIRDGWGTPKHKDNPEAMKWSAIEQARLKVERQGNIWNDSDLTKKNPHTELWAHGEHIGLSADQMGDSENGHIAMSLGRKEKSASLQIDELFRSGAFGKNPIYHAALENAKKGHTLHIWGMLSNGGIHSNVRHTIELLKEISKEREGIKKIIIHPVFDGRDVETAEKPGWLFLRDVLRTVVELNMQDTVTVGIASGRKFAMEREQANREKALKDGDPERAPKLAVIVRMWKQNFETWYNLIVAKKGEDLTGLGKAFANAA